MPVKILRLGFSELTLLFIYWLEKNNMMNETINSKKHTLKWIYTTSGYYNKNIPYLGNANIRDIIVNHYEDDVYITYMNTLLEIINQSTFDFCHGFEIHLTSCIQKVPTCLEINLFKEHLNFTQHGVASQQVVFNFIENKKILIISPFSPLIKLQLENGNCKIIYDTTPTITNISIYKFPYTFFNNGPHNNILETSHFIFNEIVNTIHDYDSVLISCGAYSCLMAKKFYDIDKNVCVVGGELTGFFGILSKRQKFFNRRQNIEIPHEEHWITTIPDEYKPIGYEQIEEGCYW
jgi:hypothetical protein